MTDLLGCPFCGAKQDVDQDISDTGVFWVQCCSCGVEGSVADTKDDAIKKWNTRPSSTAPVERREAVARIVDPEAWEVADSFSRDGDMKTAKDVAQDSLNKADAILSLPGSSRDEVLASVNAALFKPDESDAIDNLEGALTDIKRLSEAGKPTDAVCIRTLERIQVQLVNAHRALKSGVAK